MERELLEAAVAGDLGAIQRLHRAGCPLDTRGQYGETAMHCAAGRGHGAVVDWLFGQLPLLAQTTDMNNKKPVHYAARNNGLPMIKSLAAKYPPALSQPDYKGRTPYDIARGIHGSASPVAQYLLQFATTTSVPAADPAPLKRARSYSVMDPAAMRARQERAIGTVATLLRISRDAAFAVLVRYEWDTDRLAAIVGADGPAAVLAASGLDNEAEQSEEEQLCQICFCDAGTVGAGCGHLFCQECFGEFLRGKVLDDGVLVPECPEMSCGRPVPPSLFRQLLEGPDLVKYEEMLTNSLLGSKAVQACPKPGCNYVVEYPKQKKQDILCSCGFAFCWSCLEEAHRPIGCSDVGKWKKTSINEALQQRWIKEHTKPCPKCGRHIEKNGGCQHMTCRPPGGCGYEFCWLCMADWRTHRSCAQYASTAAQSSAGGNATDDFERFKHYMERFEHYEDGQQNAAQQWRALISQKQDTLRLALGFQDTELKFMDQTLNLIADAFRCLKWTYAYAYLLDPASEGRKLELLVPLQAKLEGATEQLVTLLDPSDEGGYNTEFLCRGEFEFKNFKSRVGRMSNQLITLQGALTQYLELGMEPGSQAVVGGVAVQVEGSPGEAACHWSVPPGHWKCPKCPSVNRINKRKCGVCGTWRPR